MKPPTIRTCCVRKNLSFQIILDPEVGWIGTAATSFQRHVPVWSNELYCFACLDTQAFELAVTEKICPSVFKYSDQHGATDGHEPVHVSANDQKS